MSYFILKSLELKVLIYSLAKLGDYFQNVYNEESEENIMNLDDLLGTSAEEGSIENYWYFKLLSELFDVSGAFFTIFILHEPLLFEADSPDAVATSALATFTYALPKAIVLNL